MLFGATLGGGLIAASFLDFRLYPLAWLAFVPILWALNRAGSLRSAMWAGLAAGLATNVPAFHWLIHTMHVFGGFPILVATVFYLCLSVYAALQFVLFAAGVWRLSSGPLGLVPPILWVALEFLYPNLFPWRLANSQFHAPLLLQIGDVTGPYATSFVIVWFASGLRLFLAGPRRVLPLALAGTAGALLVAYGVARWPAVELALERAPVVRVGLVQGNVGFREKGDVTLFDINVDKYVALSERLQDDVDILFWPESVAQWWVPADATSLAEDQNPFPSLSRYLVFGGLAYDDSRSRYNSAFLIDADARVLGRYDKQVLLPFGEYLPGASIFPSIARLSPQTGSFSPGIRSRTLDVPGMLRVAPLICYEDVPAGIARDMTQRGAEALLTIFNDAWFGPSVAPYQHEALALWRAVENRRYLLRVGNAGVTGIIDPFGRVVERLGMFTEGTLVSEIRPLRMDTFYTRWGDVFAWGITAIAAIWLLRGRRVRPRHAPIST